MLATATATATALAAQLGASYSSGVLAAGSPCVIVLVPLTLYRFRHGHDGVAFALFVLGFLLAYTALGLLTTQLLASPLQQGVKAGLGGAFMLLGTATARGSIEAVHLPLSSNTFALGGIFALLVSVNPWCACAPPSVVVHPPFSFF